MTDRLARALGVFFAFPLRGDRDVYGVHQRVSMLIEGLGRIAKRVDLLFYVGVDAPLEGSEVENAVTRLRRRVAADVTVELCRRARVTVTGLSRRHYLTRFLLPGSVSVHRQPAFAPFNGPEQVEALKRVLGRRPELVLVHDSRTMAPLLKWGGALPPVVLDVDNIEHRLYLRHLMRSAAWPAERLRLAWIPALLVGEFTAYRLARRLFVCSDLDRQYLRRMAIRHAATVPNAVDMPSTVPSEPGPPRLLYLGKLDYGPNATAVEHLVSDIWPRIRAAVPDAELWIAGAGDDEVRGSDRPPHGVRFLGFVEDLAALYASVRVVSTPILVGGGTRFKLIEAAAYGKAIVSTTLGAEGLQLRPDVDIILRDSPAAFADACIALLRDDLSASSLGQSARSRVRSHYSRAAVVDAIATELRSVASSAGALV
jgi:glycosyltransferase involved in cell wall biosynthesis